MTTEGTNEFLRWNLRGPGGCRHSHGGDIPPDTESAQAEGFSVSILFDALGWLFSGNLFIAGVLVLGAFYLWRGKGYAGSAAAVVGTATGYTLGLLVALAAAIGLGWIEPNPGLISDGIQSVAGPASDIVATGIEVTIESLLEGVR